MTIPQLLRLMTEISAVVEVVGIGIAEYLPREAIAVKKLLENLPLLPASGAGICMRSEIYPTP